MKTLRDLVGQEATAENPRTEAEDHIGARMPGDDLSDHPLYTGENPFTTMSFPSLMTLLEHGDITIEEERKVREAINLQRASHAWPHRIPRSSS